MLKEVKTTINRYTPRVFQEVYLVDFEKALETYGLNTENLNEKIPIIEKTINIGQLSFPINKNLANKVRPLYFKTSVFKRHTLIAGVTGSGKSRLSALIIKELVSQGAHVSILDPHDEYIDLLATSQDYNIYKISNSAHGHDSTYNKNVKFGPISFYENSITPLTLTKLLPVLSPQQEVTIYEIFNELNTTSFSARTFIDKLIDELNIELENDYSQYFDKIKKNHLETEKYSKDHIEYISRYINGLKKIIEHGKVSRANVLAAIISKINELRENKLIVSTIPNWLKDAPHSIDIFTIDYSTNNYIRRYINSIIQYFLREKNRNAFRVLVIDEAHMLLNENSDTASLVKQLLREARKFNITLVFISQNITDIPIDIRGQFQNHFIFRDTDSDITKYFPDQICHVSLYGSKSSFAMKVNNIKAIGEISPSENILSGITLSPSSEKLRT